MTKEIKIVHLIASSGLYGAEKWIYALMRAMDTSRFSSSLVNLYDAAEGQSAVVTGALERDLDAIDFNTGGSFNPLSVFKLSRWLKHNHIDIVHGHGYKSDIIGLMAGRLAGCTVISTPHGWSKEADKKLMFYETLDRFSFRFMDNICPLSPDLLESVKTSVKPEKLKLIMNGVDIDEIAAQPGLERDDKTILRIGYIGQLIERKNLETLLKAFKRLLDDNIQAELLIVGDGPESTKLKNLARDLGVQHCTHFLGYRKDAISLLKSFDVFVLPSFLEGIPRCLMEAMAAGVPVVASDIPGCRVLVEHDKTGWLYPTVNSEALFLILKSSIDDSSACYTVKLAAKKKIIDNFSNKKMAKDYQWLYSTFCGHDKTSI